MCVLVVKSALLKYEGSFGYKGNVYTSVHSPIRHHTHDNSLVYTAYYWALCVCTPEHCTVHTTRTQQDTQLEEGNGTVNISSL